MSRENFVVQITQFKDQLTRHLVHASDADQAEALLSRWGPEGQGKLGGSVISFLPSQLSPLTYFQIHVGLTLSRSV